MERSSIECELTYIERRESKRDSRYSWLYDKWLIDEPCHLLHCFFIAFHQFDDLGPSPVHAVSDSIQVGFLEVGR